MKRKRTAPTMLHFLSKLKWLDGRPMLDTVEPYRRELFTKAFDTFNADGSPVYNMVVSGRAKKNFKTTDIAAGALYSVSIRLNGDAFILANTEGQAADDLALCRKLIEVNPLLRSEFDFVQKELRRKDGRGTIKILPSGEIGGLHGKVYGYCAYDEIHDYKNWDVIEALQPDPTKVDALQWITSYDTIYNTRGVPLYDLKQIGMSGEDPRMLFSWYSGGDLNTDANFAALADPELRAILR